MKRALIAVLVASLLVSCSDDDDGGAAPATTSTTTSTTSTSIVTSGIAGLRPVSAFATMADVPLLGDDPPYAGPATPASLDGILWADYVPDAAREMLAANGFAVVARQISQFHEAYSNVEMSSRQPLFVTTDAAYHYWHLAFAKALRDTEQQVLLPILESFASRLHELADAEPVAAFAELLLAVLEIGDAPASDQVAAELDLIRDHVGPAMSPTTGADVDYSLFAPRGHYTRTPELTRYFLAMSALGQTSFLVADTEQVRTGLLMAGAITGDAELSGLWSQLYEPTAFLVGLADDYTPAELAGAADGIDPAWRTSPEVLDDAFLAQVGPALAALRPVAIDPERAAMRVMGARFVLDSFVLDQLVHPNVSGRLEGSALDVAAAFGSEWAYERQVDAGVPAAHPEYDGRLDDMRAVVADRAVEDWAGTVYDGWLHAIEPMWRAHGAAYPDFMRADAWAAKAHSTGFGSYAELKHDTLLYAKQAFAEGEAPPAPADPRHWVEPEPVVYGRLVAIAGLLRDGLAARDLLADDVADVIGRLVDMYERFERLAQDELAGAPISAEDNEWLETIASRFELLWLLAAEDTEEEAATTGGFAESPDDIAAVISDVMSNPTDALEIGTGYIDEIFVLVPNDDGAFQVARGGVYSFYEFWVPRDERVTDEAWRRSLADGTQPDRPAWTEAFVVEP